MKLLIRESIPIDDAAVEAVALAATSASALLEAGRFWDSPHQFQRWIAKWNGQLVAYTDYAQAPQAPDEFWINVCVHPHMQRRGIGSALYTHLLNALLPLGPLALKARLHPERAEAVRFLTARGYRVESHVHRPDGRLIGHVTLVKLFKSALEKEDSP
jgi:GNAT superfamily N-acetyltransferase